MRAVSLVGLHAPPEGIGHLLVAQKELHFGVWAKGTQGAGVAAGHGEQQRSLPHLRPETAGHMAGDVDAQLVLGQQRVVAGGRAILGVEAADVTSAPGSSRLSSAAAMGLRQVLPVQTQTIFTIAPLLSEKLY